MGGQNGKTQASMMMGGQNLCHMMMGGQNKMMMGGQNQVSRMDDGWSKPIPAVGWPKRRPANADMMMGSQNPYQSGMMMGGQNPGQ
ncbi:hypothetical protein [Peribacillus sp. FSL P2-0133]|uniref:hypothetical protein n=1 Tax=Peribacillus sp. FSL P2-0133 TaxID=2921573 RepID=UPI0030D1D105